MDLSQPQSDAQPNNGSSVSATLSTADKPSAKLAPHVVVRGSPHQRGRQYGKFAASRVVESIKTYRGMFELCDISWTQAQQFALPYVDVIEKTFPSLLEELQGLSEGSGVDFASLMALNCRTEILPSDFLARASGLPASQLPDGGQINECTSLAVARADKPVWLAQNWDWVGQQRDALVLVESHPDDGPAHLTVCEAGMLAKIGLNEHGLGITLNILRSFDDGAKPGMPVHLLLRGLLDCRDVQSACELALGLAYTSSSNVMVADPAGNIASIELAPAGARVLESNKNQLCHTNHFLHADLADNDASDKENLSTSARLSMAQQKIDAIDGLDGINELLSDTSEGDESVCRFPDESMAPAARIETVVGVAMNLSDRELWLTAAQPSESTFTRFGLH